MSKERKISSFGEGFCPKCGVDNIDYQDEEREDEIYVYYASCNDCKIDFRQVYTLEYLHTTFEEG